MSTELEVFEKQFKKIVKDKEIDVIFKRIKNDPIFILNNIINELNEILDYYKPEIEFARDDTAFCIFEEVSEEIKKLNKLLENLELEEKIKDLD